MAGENKETPQAGLTQEQIVALIQKTNKETIAELLKPFGEQLGTLAQNQKVLADTYAADKTAAEKAAAEATAKTAEKKPGEAETPKALTADEIKKLVADGVAAAQTAQQQTAEQKQNRTAFLSDPKNGLARLPAAFQDKLGSDPAKWADEAKSIVGGWETFAKENKIALPDVGGASRDGGNSPGAGAGGEAAAKPGSWIKYK